MKCLFFNIYLSFIIYQINYSSLLVFILKNFIISTIRIGANIKAIVSASLSAGNKTILNILLKAGTNNTINIKAAETIVANINIYY